MSMSDRLAKIAARIVRARHGDHGDRYMVLDVDAPALVSALQAVLNVCDESTIQARPHGDGEPYMIVRADDVRNAIAAALGEGS